MGSCVVEVCGEPCHPDAQAADDGEACSECVGVNCGAVWTGPLEAGQRDLLGKPIDSEWVLTDFHSLFVGTPIEPDEAGNTSPCSVGALTYVHEQLLAARDRGAAVLLISEDLDEVTALSDVIHVISEGRLSPPFARGALTPAELGVWMAGDGFEETSHAA